MSVTTYYGRLSHEQFDAIRADSTGLEQFFNGSIPQDQMLYLDKATPVIAWLLSPHKRHEQAHFAAVVRADDISNFEKPDLGPEPPLDEILIPIEGRGEKEECLDLGLGPACVPSAEEVHRFAPMLTAVTQAQLRQELDFQRLDDAALPLDYWTEEGEEMFSEYVLPLFVKLQEFFATASQNNQLVLVWYA